MSPEIPSPSASFKAANGALPKNRELHETFSKVMAAYAYLNTQPAGVPGMVLRPMAKEFKVNLKGPRHSGALVVRTSEALGPFLLEAAAGEVGEDDNPDDALREVVNLYCGHVLTECFEPRGMEFGFFLPKPSTPEDWPLRPPDSAAAVLVEDIPVEIRLWIDETPEETSAKAG